VVCNFYLVNFLLKQFNTCIIYRNIKVNNTILYLHNRSNAATEHRDPDT